MRWMTAMMAGLIGLSILAGGNAWAEPLPSFECAKARTATEKAICKDASLAWLDQRLTKLYGDLRSLLAEAARTPLRDEQREWIGRRDACGGDVACITRAYWQRLRALSGRIPNRGLTGEYQYTETGMDGTLSLVELPGNRVSGWIETVNLARLHNCSVDMAEMIAAGQTMTWNDPEEFDGKHCRVDITVGPGGAVVAAQNCTSWCGMAGFFEGRYQKK